MGLNIKIAVVGSGISGLTAAYSLSRKFDVKLFEKADRFGGHSNTIKLDLGKDIVSVDTGFIVYNTTNYPNLTSLFEHLKNGKTHWISRTRAKTYSRPKSSRENQGLEGNTRGIRGIQPSRSRFSLHGLRHALLPYRDDLEQYGQWLSRQQFDP